MNHLRKLALLSSLALSFSVAVQADGTLPLPIVELTPPLVLADDNVDLRVSINNMKPVTILDNFNGTQACNPGEELYVATGKVFHGVNQMDLVGICKLKKEPATLPVVNRTVVAIPTGEKSKTASVLIRMAGTVQRNATLTDFETFKGTMTTKVLGTAPVTPGLSEAESLTAPVPFEFIR
jgi:hypothetical protein